MNQRNLTNAGWVLTFLLFLITNTAFGQSNAHPDTPVFPKRWTLPTEMPDRIILTFAGDPAAQQSVTWRTDTTVLRGVAEIAVADASPNFWRNAQAVTSNVERLDAGTVKGAEVVANYHSVTFTNLQSDVLYAYRVGDGVHWSEWFQFRTASREAKPFSFLYVGDAQNYILELWSRLIRAGFSKAPDARFIIHAGDLVSEAHSERQWHEWFTAGGWIHGMLPSVPVAGNHEYRATQADSGPKGAQLSVQWRPQFSLPQNGPKGLAETAYWFDYQGVRLIVLNSNRDQKEQTPWLDSLLANNPNPWTIVSLHHPIFSAAGERDNKEIRKLWKPLFDKYGVDLVLQGHDHSYARGHSAPVAENTVKGVNTRDAQTGTVYVVSVSGGKMYTLKKELWSTYDEATLERKAENTQLFQVIRVDGNKLQYQAFTATGELYDAFDLTKAGKKGPNRFTERLEGAVGERRFGNTIPAGNNPK